MTDVNVSCKRARVGDDDDQDDDDHTGDGHGPGDHADHADHAGVKAGAGSGSVPCGSSGPKLLVYFVPCNGGVHDTTGVLFDKGMYVDIQNPAVGNAVDFIFHLHFEGSDDEGPSDSDVKDTDTDLDSDDKAAGGGGGAGAGGRRVFSHVWETLVAKVTSPEWVHQVMHAPMTPMLELHAVDGEGLVNWSHEPVPMKGRHLQYSSHVDELASTLHDLLCGPEWLKTRATIAFAVDGKTPTRAEALVVATVIVHCEAV